jgi:flagellar motor switch protein FliM
MAEDDTIDDGPETPGGGSADDQLAAEWAAMAEGDSGGGGADDDLAAEWAAMLGDGGEGGGVDRTKMDDEMAERWSAMIGDGDDDGLGRSGAERILNQDEIDSLLGFNVADDSDGEGGIQAIINSTLVSYERLPMLEIVFDRLVRLMTTSLRNFTSDNVEVSIDGISSIRFGDYLASIPLPAILSVFKAKEWDNYGLITVDSNLIYSIVDVLLGGRHSQSKRRIEGRPYTTIETGLVERLLEVVLADAQAAFEPLSPVVFELDRIETNPRFTAITRPANAAIAVKLRIDMEDRGGKIELLLPYATLEPIRELLLQMFMGEKFGRDAIWEGHLASELWVTEVQLDAVLDEQQIPLRQAMNLKVGQTLMLNCTGKGVIDLRCGGVSLLKGRMGRVGNHVAVQIVRAIPQNRRRFGDRASAGDGEQLKVA